MSEFIQNKLRGKVLYCPGCNEYKDKVYINASVFHRAKLVDDEWIIYDLDFDYPWRPSIYLCNECDGELDVVMKPNVALEDE